MEKPRPLYKPQEESVDINVNVYENESCHNTCNDTVGCSAGNVVAGCDCGSINVVAGCGASGGINFVPGCGASGGGINFVPGCGASGGGINFVPGCGG